jgi:hypothetical protein
MHALFLSALPAVLENNTVDPDSSPSKKPKIFVSERSAGLKLLSSLPDELHQFCFDSVDRFLERHQRSRGDGTAYAKPPPRVSRTTVDHLLEDPSEQNKEQFLVQILQTADMERDLRRGLQNLVRISAGLLYVSRLLLVYYCFAF